MSKTSKKKGGKKRKSRKTESLNPAPDFNVSIPKSGLGKDYLMSASMIPQASWPNTDGTGAGRSPSIT